MTIWRLIKDMIYPKSYIWQDVLLLKETAKAILIMFDGKKAWFPKAWAIKIRWAKRCEEARRADAAISIKISEYHWHKKF